MGRVEQIHFVGIGGTGMCGIAEVLHNEGYRITGSDVCENRTVQRLRSLGIQIHIGHCSENIEGADVVVRSTAIVNDNPEVIAAHRQFIPVIPRAAMLAELMRFRHGIAIAGTHGKTTTTSLVSSLLAEGGLDPSFVIGGRLNSCGSNAQLGKSAYFVAEADESDASFLFLKPMTAVVTNIDMDHMETYDGSLDKLKNTFIEFLHHLPFYGLAVVCLEDKEVRNILPMIQRPTVTYGFSEDAHYRAVDWKQNGLTSEFKVIRPAPHSELNIQFQWPGRHNVLNALAAIAVATDLGVDDQSIANGLAKFQGVGRRFQLLGHRQFIHGNALVVDDYGHHPQEIVSTIDAFRQVWPDKRLVHVFQPHRYSRTKALYTQLANALSLADEVLLLDIYPAGEQAITGVSSESLASEVRLKQPKITLVNENNLESTLDGLVGDGDVILMQGAGSIGQMAINLMQKVQESA
ncbi:UDP-N-acetylmuramate--L-alanine ligase [Legionella israelensis]|uniref:UDP-N-acetylmuramate--L-alanine ligase n=1 Tax=Legionella israelensis TaxID=454 RepID=A0A0W0WQY2_9GAMM|nr:UDP-N-acetylmuramate--L-alanine ligase [Legionella israelensis]KTD34534.1 UDP-N-acetylmuramate--L-alanine ligase [Legionella israelensis]QBR85283.1 UDP-N-acetylmuramate--L-alanine ligase [Legionella israelensis]QBS11071.1 UDP-N-acetylmuramate--L-alanine ligase [Legionella israelensis]QDP73581.1 UDP-N-acetylmuramate--L-alanine ligase [Legionella israelensis]SCX98566.1 UDP-N-acetylmuramate--L-alanine ligase [Legionella israelensis DSM 19235]